MSARQESYLLNILNSLENVDCSQFFNSREATLLIWRFSRLSKIHIDAEDVELLKSCCLKLADMLLKWSETLYTVTVKHKELMYSLFYVLKETGGNPSLRNTFVERIVVPLLERITDPSVKTLCGNELAKNLNGILQNSDKATRIEIVKSYAKIYMFKLVDIVSICGDYEYQTSLIEIIFRMCSTEFISEHANDFFPASEVLQDSFRKIDIKNFDRSLRIFLNTANSVYKHVVSVKASSVYLDDISVTPPLDNYQYQQDLWVDFNTLSRTIGIFCDKNSVATSLSGSSRSEDDGWELLTFFCSDISHVKLEAFKGGRGNFAVNTYEIQFHKTSPCHAFFKSSREASSAKILKLRICDKDKINDLRNIFPNLFQGKFGTLIDTGDISTLSLKNKLSSDGVYKPLNICLTGKRKSCVSNDSRSEKSLENSVLVNNKAISKEHSVSSTQNNITDSVTYRLHVEEYGKENQTTCAIHSNNVNELDSSRDAIHCISDKKVNNIYRLVSHAKQLDAKIRNKGLNIRRLIPLYDLNIVNEVIDLTEDEDNDIGAKSNQQDSNSSREDIVNTDEMETLKCVNFNLEEKCSKESSVITKPISEVNDTFILDLKNFNGVINLTEDEDGDSSVKSKKLDAKSSSEEIFNTNEMEVSKSINHHEQFSKESSTMTQLINESSKTDAIFKDTELLHLSAVSNKESISTLNQDNLLMEKKFRSPAVSKRQGKVKKKTIKFKFPFMSRKIALRSEEDDLLDSIDENDNNRNTTVCDVDTVDSSEVKQVQTQLNKVQSYKNGKNNRLCDVTNTTNFAIENEITSTTNNEDEYQTKVNELYESVMSDEDLFSQQKEYSLKLSNATCPDPILPTIQDEYTTSDDVLGNSQTFIKSSQENFNLQLKINNLDNDHKKATVTSMERFEDKISPFEELGVSKCPNEIKILHACASEPSATVKEASKALVNKETTAVIVPNCDEIISSDRDQMELDVVSNTIDADLTSDSIQVCVEKNKVLRELKIEQKSDDLSIMQNDIMKSMSQQAQENANAAKRKNKTRKLKKRKGKKNKETYNMNKLIPVVVLKKLNIEANSCNSDKARNELVDLVYSKMQDKESIEPVHSKVETGNVFQQPELKIIDHLAMEHNKDQGYSDNNYISQNALGSLGHCDDLLLLKSGGEMKATFAVETEHDDRTETQYTPFNILADSENVHREICEPEDISNPTSDLQLVNANCNEAIINVNVVSDKHLDNSPEDVLNPTSDQQLINSNLRDAVINVSVSSDARVCDNVREEFLMQTSDQQLIHGNQKGVVINENVMCDIHTVDTAEIIENNLQKSIESKDKLQKVIPDNVKDKAAKIIYDTKNEHVFSHSKKPTTYKNSFLELRDKLDRTVRERFNQSDTELFRRPIKLRKLYNPNDWSYLENIKYNMNEFKSSDSENDVSTTIVTSAEVHTAIQNKSRIGNRNRTKRIFKKPSYTNEDLDLITVCEPSTSTSVPKRPVNMTKALLKYSVIPDNDTCVIKIPEVVKNKGHADASQELDTNKVLYASYTKKRSGIKPPVKAKDKKKDVSVPKIRASKKLDKSGKKANQENIKKKRARERTPEYSSRMDENQKELYISYLSCFSNVSPPKIRNKRQKPQKSTKKNIKHKPDTILRSLQNDGYESMDSDIVLSKFSRKRRIHFERDTVLVKKMRNSVDLSPLPELTIKTAMKKSTTALNAPKEDNVPMAQLGNLDVIRTAGSNNKKEEFRENKIIVLQNVLLHPATYSASTCNHNIKSEVDSLHHLSQIEESSCLLSNCQAEFKNFKSNHVREEIHSWVATGRVDDQRFTKDNCKHILELCNCIVKQILHMCRGPVSSNVLQEYEIFARLEEILQTYFHNGQA